MGFKVVAIPPAYSDADQDRRSLIMQRLSELDREMRERSRPLLDMLVEIESHYAPRMMLVPDDAEQNKSETATSEQIENGLEQFPKPSR